MKVYGWTTFARGTQERAIMASPSKAAVLRAHPESRSSLAETGNERELAFALGSPGVVFYASIYGSHDRHYESESSERSDGSTLTREQFAQYNLLVSKLHKGITDIGGSKEQRDAGMAYLVDYLNTLMSCK